jgi:flagellin
MALTVATNTGALMAQAAASSVNKEMEISMERLATGKRINGAADDAAGVAIASRLSAEIKGTNQAIRNAMDGQALIDTAEGAHEEIETILQRMRELAVQSANDTNSTSDRTNIQTEMDQLTNEIDRIAATTTWAGVELLDDSASALNFQIGSGTNAADFVTIDIDGVSATNLGVKGAAASGDVSASGHVGLSVSGSVLTIADNDIGATDTFTVAMGTGTIVLTADKDIDGDTAGVTTNEIEMNEAAAMVADLFNRSTDTDAAGFTAVASTDGSGGITIQKGAISVSSTSNAQSAITKIDTALATLNTQRAELGAYSNRFDNTVSNLTNISSNLTAGKGRIEDADFAAETTSLAKSQILQQASTAMLAQANASKQNVLSLLQG